jgi:hypothetical protein
VRLSLRWLHLGNVLAVLEKTGRVPKMADTSMRLIYTAHADGDARAKSIVTALNETERFMLVLKEIAKGWTATTEVKPTGLKNKPSGKVHIATA